MVPSENQPSEAIRIQINDCQMILSCGYEPVKIRLRIFWRAYERVAVRLLFCEL